MTLFTSKRRVPLAWRMQPRSLEDFVGQEHLLAQGRVLRRAIEEDALVSLILYGPPGTGKTALAHIVARRTQSEFITLNAVTAGVGDIRKAVLTAESAALAGRSSILFVDEIHRFNKVQQDALLPEVEGGRLTLIGASTENPFFALVPPLASRSMIFQFRPLSESSIRAILERALSDGENGLGALNVRMTEPAFDRIAALCGGDARKALNALELSVHALGKESPRSISEELVAEVFQKSAAYYSEDDHYDVISAFIKSMRGSDPDASIYWLGRMLESGEDPRFIARRIMICAAEDVGNADPRALTVSVAAARAAEEVGMPEARIPLAQAALYVATAPKSNSVILAIDAALEEVRGGRVQRVPAHLRDAHYPGAQRLGAGIGYQYPHDFEGHFVDQVYLTEPREFYHPSREGFERDISERMKRRDPR